VLNNTFGKTRKCYDNKVEVRNAICYVTWRDFRLKELHGDTTETLTKQMCLNLAVISFEIYEVDCYLFVVTDS